MEHCLFAILSALGVVVMTLAVCLLVMLVGAFLSFTRSDYDP